MIDEIGENAGVVWKYLEDHGEMSGTGIAKGTGMKQKAVDRAIGWLAREDKIRITKIANKETITLVQVAS